MIRSIFCAPDTPVDTTLPVETAHGRLQSTKDALLWVDICEASPAETEHVLRDIFAFHPLAVDDALNESHSPKVDDWGDYLYLTLHSVTHQPQSWEQLDTLEVDIFVGPGYVVTYQSRPVTAVERVWGLVQRDERHVSRGPDHILYLLADELVADYFPVVDDIDDELDLLENELVERPEQVEMERIFRLKRTLVHLRRTVGPLREVMSRLSRNGYPALDPRSGVYFRDVYDHLVRLYDITESLRDLLTGTLDIYLSVVNNRMNQVMKVLTVVSTILLPLTFITGFFGMNFFEPVADFHHWTGRAALALTMALIVGTPLGMYLWMRRRAWM